MLLLMLLELHEVKKMKTLGYIQLRMKTNECDDNDENSTGARSTTNNRQHQDSKMSLTQQQER